MLLPHCKCLLHAGIGKEFHTNLSLDRPSHNTLQVGPPGYLVRRDTNLRNEPTRIGNRGTEDQPVQARPESAAHAHRARFARRIQGVALEGDSYWSGKIPTP